jgi:hypothetical protein
MTLSINRTPILNVTSLNSLGLLYGFKSRIAVLGRIISQRHPWMCKVQAYGSRSYVEPGGIWESSQYLLLMLPQRPLLVRPGCSRTLTMINFL